MVIFGLTFAFFALPSVFSLVLSLGAPFVFDLVFPPVDLSFDSGSALVAKPLWTGHLRGGLGEILHGSSLRADKRVPERKRVRLSTEDSMIVEQHFELLGYG
jgi:hypothetical protein